MSIVQFGFLMCGPPCALFIYLSCSVHKRSKSQPWGNHEKDSVRRANVIMINLAIILTIAHERFVFIGMLSLDLGIVWVDTFLGTYTRLPAYPPTARLSLAYPPTRLPAYPPNRLPAYPLTRLPARLPDCPPTCQPARPPTRPAAHPPTRPLTTHLPTYLPPRRPSDLPTCLYLPFTSLPRLPTYSPTRLPADPPPCLPAYPPTRLPPDPPTLDSPPGPSWIPPDLPSLMAHFMA